MCRVSRILLTGFMFASLVSCSKEDPSIGSAADAVPSQPAQSEAKVSSTGSSEVKGVASYRERMALPPDAVFEATLEDVSRADAPAQVIGRVRMDPAGQPPFRFAIPYDAAQLQPGHNYVLRARISRQEQLLFTTDRHYAMPPNGHEIDLMLVRAQPTREEGSASTATLENTYWKLVQLGDQPVDVASEQREPYIVLHSEEKRVAGFGGCNRLTGGYTLSGDKLTFSQMAGTMMACDEGMEYEKALHEALLKVASWRIEGETLDLYDESGSLIAHFESRYL